MVSVLVNGSPREVPDGTTVDGLVRADAGADPRGVAVARNGTVVPRGRWADTSVAEGDRIEILGAAQGG